MGRCGHAVIDTHQQPEQRREPQGAIGDECLGELDVTGIKDLKLVLDPGLIKALGRLFMHVGTWTCMHQGMPTCGQDV